MQVGIACVDCCPGCSNKCAHGTGGTAAVCQCVASCAWFLDPTPLVCLVVDELSKIPCLAVNGPTQPARCASTNIEGVHAMPCLLPASLIICAQHAPGNNAAQTCTCGCSVCLVKLGQCLHACNASHMPTSSLEPNATNSNATVALCVPCPAGCSRQPDGRVRESSHRGQTGHC